MADGKKKGSGGQPHFEGPDRRSPDLPDRRRKPRGGRRATDTFKRLATFAFKLLTEPPR